MTKNALTFLFITILAATLFAIEITNEHLHDDFVGETVTDDPKLVQQQQIINETRDASETVTDDPKLVQQQQIINETRDANTGNNYFKITLENYDEPELKAIISARKQDIIENNWNEQCEKMYRKDVKIIKNTIKETILSQASDLRDEVKRTTEQLSLLKREKDDTIARFSENMREHDIQMNAKVNRINEELLLAINDRSASSIQSQKQLILEKQECIRIYNEYVTSATSNLDQSLQQYESLIEKYQNYMAELKTQSSVLVEKQSAFKEILKDEDETWTKSEIPTLPESSPVNLDITTQITQIDSAIEDKIIENQQRLEKNVINLETELKELNEKRSSIPQEKLTLEIVEEHNKEQEKIFSTYEQNKKMADASYDNDIKILEQQKEVFEEARSKNKNKS